MSATTETTPAEEKVRTTRTANPELAAMARIDRILAEDLPTDEARGRAVRWLTAYYGPTLADRIEAAR